MGGATPLDERLVKKSRREGGLRQVGSHGPSSLLLPVTSAPVAPFATCCSPLLYRTEL
jgi:hypothetical protein